jgi:hypothetical protein
VDSTGSGGEAGGSHTRRRRPQPVDRVCGARSGCAAMPRRMRTAPTAVPRCQDGCARPPAHALPGDCPARRRVPAVTTARRQRPPRPATRARPATNAPPADACPPDKERPARPAVPCSPSCAPRRLVHTAPTAVPRPRRLRARPTTNTPPGQRCPVRKLCPAPTGAHRPDGSAARPRRLRTTRGHVPPSDARADGRSRRPRRTTSRQSRGIAPGVGRHTPDPCQSRGIATGGGPPHPRPRDPRPGRGTAGSRAPRFPDRDQSSPCSRRTRETISSIISVSW